MPMNNNQKFQSAAARLAKLPLVRSACSTVSVLYIDTKSSHPNLRSVCEVLESRVTAISTAACDKMTPVMVRLEPQISIVNDVACKSLDWLETTFPVLHAPTDQVVAAARNKMNEIQDVVSITANGTVDTVTWLMGRIQQADKQTNQPLMQRAIDVADVGLDSALIMSETLMEHMLPLSEEDKEAEAHLLEGFEVATLRRSYRARLLLLAARLCSRTYHLVGSKIQSVQLRESLSRSSGRIQDLQTSWLTFSLSIQELPQYLQHQLVSVLFFISQMYNLSGSQSQQQHQDRAHLNAAGTSTHRDVVCVQSRATPTSRARRPTKMSPFENGSNGKGWVHR